MPSYYTAVVNPNTQLTASFRETVEDIRNAFLSCSFTRTVQSGSIDNISALNPPITNDQQITYDIFAFNDALQSTSPLFIKVRYRGSGGNAPSCNGIQLWTSMGTAHDNSGSLTGIDALTEVGIASATSFAIVSGSTINASGDGSYMSLVVFPQMLHTQLAVFERLYDINGQPTGSGFHMLATDVNRTVKTLHSQMALVGKTPATRETIWIPNSRPSRAPSLYDGRLVLGLIYPFFGKPYNPSPNILVGTSTDFPNTLQAVRYTVYGAERLYMALGSNFNVANCQLYTNGRFLLRMS
jgi:hypothetical protein